MGRIIPYIMEKMLETSNQYIIVLYEQQGGYIPLIYIYDTYGGWLRNPAPPKGWLKPKQNNGMFTTYQLAGHLKGRKSGFFIGNWWKIDLWDTFGGLPSGITFHNCSYKFEEV
jgi:hypothetical protein